MKKLVIVALVAAAIGLSTAYGFGVFDEVLEFRKTTTAILTAMDTEEGAEQVYEDASFTLRQSINREGFLDLRERMHKTLGKFVEIDGVDDTARSSSPNGTTAYIAYELIFEHGETIGSMSYYRRRKTNEWQLMAIEVEIPPELRQKANQVAIEPKRLKAPPEVEAKVAALLELIAQGKGDEVWDSAAPTFQTSVSKERFRELTKIRRETIGVFKHVVAVLISQQSESKSKAFVNAYLKFDKANTSGDFEFIRVGDQWQLLRFKILLPQPVLPTRATGLDLPVEQTP